MSGLANRRLCGLSVERDRRGVRLAMAACREVHHKSRNDDERTEEKPIHPHRGFVVAFHHRQAEEQQRKHSRENRTAQPPGSRNSAALIITSHKRTNRGCKAGRFQILSWSGQRFQGTLTLRTCLPL